MTLTRLQRQGATVEELAAQFRQATDRYEAAQKDLKDMSNLKIVDVRGLNDLQKVETFKCSCLHIK